MDDREEGLRIAQRLAKLGVIPEATLWINNSEGILRTAMNWIIVLLLAVLLGVGVAMVKERNRALSESAHDKCVGTECYP